MKQNMYVSGDTLEGKNVEDVEEYVRKEELNMIWKATY